MRYIEIKDTEEWGGYLKFGKLCEVFGRLKVSSKKGQRGETQYTLSAPNKRLYGLPSHVHLTRQLSQIPVGSIVHILCTDEIDDTNAQGKAFTRYLYRVGVVEGDKDVMRAEVNAILETRPHMRDPTPLVAARSQQQHENGRDDDDDGFASFVDSLSQHAT